MTYKDPEKQKAYQRQWKASRRASFYEDKSCIKCGSKDRLQLDHIDPSQKVSHRIWSWSESRRLVEIAKCQVLCYFCHRAKTVKNVELAHGIQNAFAKLNPEKVLEIKTALSQGVTTKALGEKYGVDPSAIRSIRRGDTWSRVI